MSDRLEEVKMRGAQLIAKKREMSAGECVESLRVGLTNARDELEKIDDKMANLAADRRYWQGQKDAISEAISVIEGGTNV